MNYNLDLNIKNEYKNNNYSFTRTNTNDFNEILNLYIERINWFKENL